MPEAGLREARTFGLEAPNGWISDNPKWWHTLLTLTRWRATRARGRRHQRRRRHLGGVGASASKP